MLQWVYVAGVCVATKQEIQHKSPATKQKIQHEQFRSKTSIEDLPLDVSLNILKQLPITSLLSLKIVSKACYNLATHPRLTPHQHYQNKPHCLIILPLTLDKTCADHFYVIDNNRNCDKENDIRDCKALGRINRSMMGKKFKVKTILSANGLLCLLFCKNKGSYYRVCLFNPLTSEHHFLPDLELTKPGNSTQDINFVVCSQFFGFGYNSRTRKYKVVRIEHSLIAGKTRYEHSLRAEKSSIASFRTCLEIEVFTLGKNGSQTSRINNLFGCPEKSSDVVVGGAIHWLWKGKMANSIVSFDLLKEKLVQIANPDFEIGRNCFLSVFGECLSLIVPHPWKLENLEIWKMKEYGVKDSWTREFVIKERFPVTLRTPGLLHPQIVLSSGKILVSYEDEALYSYDPEEKLFEQIDVAEMVPKRFKAIHYTPSLVSPKFSS